MGGDRRTSPTPPGDREIRESLRAWIRQQSTRDSVLLEELGLVRHSARADVAVVNGAMHAYEIKSDRDTLRRLPVQAGVYDSVFDFCTAVVGPGHVEAVHERVPPHWGILLARRRATEVALTTVRAPERNPYVEPRAQVELLWLDDALELLSRRNAVRGLRSKPRSLVWDRVCDVFGPDEIAAEVRAQLKARAVQRSAR